MALTDFQQAYTFLGNAKNILIVSGHKETNDSYPASVAFAKALHQTRKSASIFCKESAPENFKFLNSYFGGAAITLISSINGSRNFIISVDISDGPVKSVGYKVDGPWLNINITPLDNTSISEKNVHTGLSGFSYDLIITLGLHDLESVGEEFEKNAALFFNTPIVNIDRNPSNERYGEVNIIDSLASCCCEIATDFLKKWDESLINKDMATLLLAGLVSSTNNFQNEKTKPSALLQAAYLMSKEASHQEVIKNLLKTKSFEFLKLLGIATTNFQYDERRRLGWFCVSPEHFEQTGSSYKLLPLLIAELKNALNDCSCLAAFWQTRQNRFCIINSKHEKQTRFIQKNMQGDIRGDSLLVNLSKAGLSDENEAISTLKRIIDKETRS